MENILKDDFDKTNMKGRGKFGLIVIECFVSIGEDIIVIDIFIAYLRVKYFLFVSKAIFLASNSILFIRHVHIHLWLVLKQRN